LCQNPSILVNANTFEDEVGGPVFTSELLEYAAQEQENCEYPIRFHLQSTCEQVWCNLFPYKPMGSEARPLERLKSLGGDQVKLDNFPLPALRPSSIAAMPPPRYIDLLDSMYADFLYNPFWLCLGEQILRSTVKINNIVWYTDHECRPKARLRSHQQHFLARAIADTFQDRHTTASGKTAPDIRIVAYDPAYTVGDMEILSFVSTSIDVISMSRHFLSLTANSLVIIAGPPQGVPILELLADVLYPTGPAAILMDESRRYSFHDKENIRRCDQRTPRANRFLETLYDEICNPDFVDEEKQRDVNNEGQGALRYDSLPQEQQLRWMAQKMYWYTRKM
jgi:hypothetical protein